MRGPAAIDQPLTGGIPGAECGRWIEPWSQVVQTRTAAHARARPCRIAERYELVERCAAGGAAGVLHGKLTVHCEHWREQRWTTTKPATRRRSGRCEPRPTELHALPRRRLSTESGCGQCLRMRQHAGQRDHAPSPLALRPAHRHSRCTSAPRPSAEAERNHGALQSTTRYPEGTSQHREGGGHRTRTCKRLSPRRFSRPLPYQLGLALRGTHEK